MLQGLCLAVTWFPQHHRQDSNQVLRVWSGETHDTGGYVCLLLTGACQSSLIFELFSVLVIVGGGRSWSDGNSDIKLLSHIKTSERDNTITEKDKNYFKDAKVVS